jgi:hypothetical protein
METTESIPQRFAMALDTLTETIKGDRSILAAILCGSLAYDSVWEKSDIDLVLVGVDDKKVQTAAHALLENNVNIHVHVLARSEFRKLVEGALRHSFIQSLLAHGRLLYSHDPSIASIFATLQHSAMRDNEIQLLRAGIGVLPLLYKAQKWFHVRRDLDYCALWLLYAATALAQIEVISRRQLVDREVIPQALALNPDFFSSDLYRSAGWSKNRRSAADRFAGGRGLSAATHYAAVSAGDRLSAAGW